MCLVRREGEVGEATEQRFVETADALDEYSRNVLRDRLQGIDDAANPYSSELTGNRVLDSYQIWKSGQIDEYREILDAMGKPLDEIPIELVSVDPLQAAQGNNMVTYLRNGELTFQNVLVNTARLLQRWERDERFLETTDYRKVAQLLSDVVSPEGATRQIRDAQVLMDDATG